MRVLTVLPGQAGSARLDDGPEPASDDGSVLVGTLAVGVCGTDAEILQGHYGTAPPGRERLVHDGFVDRYPTLPAVDGLPSGEGAFVVCTFWLADNLVLQGRDREARDICERLLGLGNDVGRLSEACDPETGRLVGNFPQALAHVGLINTARNLSRHGGPAEKRPGH